MARATTAGLAAGRTRRVACPGRGVGDRDHPAGHRAGHPAPGGQVFRRGDALVTRFQFVADHRDTFEVKRLCEIVDVARSSFYAWLAAAPARAVRASADAALAQRIRAIHDTDRAQGVPRITAELNDGADPTARVNHKRVARIMRQEQIAGLRLRRRVRTTVPDPAEQTVPDLIIDALSAARDTRGGLAGAIFHSDHGAQYTSRAFAEHCRALGVTQSMGSVGTSADNALAESFNATLKRETLRGGHAWPDEHTCRREVFRWVTRYNTRRRHSWCGQQPPITYEQRHAATLQLAA